jgi:nucleoside 2-deoxyribosyltransferase
MVERTSPSAGCHALHAEYLEAHLRIYLAGKYKWRGVILCIAAKLEKRGHEITSRWLNGSHEDLAEHAQERYAREDFEDIDAAEEFILFQLPVDDPEVSTGRHVEYGYAIGRGKSIIIVGQHSSVFHRGEHIRKFPSLDAFYKGYLINDQGGRS